MVRGGDGGDLVGGAGGLVYQLQVKTFHDGTHIPSSWEIQRSEVDSVSGSRGGDGTSYLCRVQKIRP